MTKTLVRCLFGFLIGLLPLFAWWCGYHYGKVYGIREIQHSIEELQDESRAWIARMLGQQTARVVNLQELARDMFDGMCDHDCCDICPHWQEGYNWCEYHARMRELGVEVD